MSKSFLFSIFSKASSITNTRYVNRFVLIKQKYDKGRSELHTQDEKSAHAHLTDSVGHYKALAEKCPVIN